MQSPSSLRRAIAPPLLALALLACAAEPALGHASFLGANPAPGQRVEAAPGHITLRFSEELNRRLSRARIVAASGQRAVPVRRLAAPPRELVLAPARPLGRGAYSVDWTSVSTEDGHQLAGSFGFGVRVAAAGGGRALEQSPLAGGGWARAAARALLYATLLLFCGGLLLRVLLRAPGEDAWLVPRELAGRLRARGIDPGEPARRERTLVADAGVLAAALAAVAALADAFHAAGRVTLSAVDDFLLANWTGIARVALVGLLLVATALAARRPRAAALCGLAGLGCVVVAGHANSARPRALALAADWTHLVAAAVWVGGIALLVLCLGGVLNRGGRDARLDVARTALPRFGRVALPAFAVVALTGTLSAIVEVGRVSSLWSSAYGAVLLVKVGFVALLAAASFNHALRLRPRLVAANPHPDERLERRHWRLLRAEPLLGLGAVAAVGLLVAFPLPPRQLRDAGAAAAVPVPPCNPCPLPTPGARELAVAGEAGSGILAAWIRRPRGIAIGTLRLLDYRGRPAPGAVTVAGGAVAPCGRGCTLFRVPAPGDRLVATVARGGRRHRVALPARWGYGRTRWAGALLSRAQATMRALRAVGESERVSSGPGTQALTRYRLVAPDRLAYRTGLGVQTVVVGARQWVRTPDLPWAAGPVPGGVPFTTRSWFRWTPYATAVRLLEVRSQAGRRVAELALMDPGTPVWTTLGVDVASGRVLRERLVAPARFIDHRYFGFDRPVRIEPPRTAVHER